MTRSGKGILLALLAFGMQGAWGRSGYAPSGVCDGLPALALATPPGFCVGLLAEGFKFPRGIAVLDNGDLIVADMAGWTENRGSIWRLVRDGNVYRRTRLFAEVDRPHGVRLGPDRKVYVAAARRIFRFDPQLPDPVAEDVVGGATAVDALPGSGRHPLVSLAFDPAGNLIVGIGSATDHCEDESGAPPRIGESCTETTGALPRAVIRKFEFDRVGGTVTGWHDIAFGLRNSLALAVDPRTGAIWQGENSRDAISLAAPGLDEASLPHDELNRIVAGAHYGWPYCFDNNRPSPEYAAVSCAGYRRPARLLPAHAAPLGMAFSLRKGAPAPLDSALIMAFHGYRSHGHRVVAYRFSAAGMPMNKPVDLIADWGAKPGQPMGAPVDVAIGSDGAVYVTEDRNGTVLRLVYRGE